MKDLTGEQIRHIASLIDERLEQYLDEVDEEFSGHREAPKEIREFVRGKMIAIVECRSILDNVIDQRSNAAEEK